MAHSLWFSRPGRCSRTNGLANRPGSFFLILVMLAATAGVSVADDVAADHAEQMAASLELFKSDVGPLLVAHCLKCHGGEQTHGEFDLSTREGLVKGGEQGPAVVVGKPGESLLLALVRHEVEPHMPQESDKLSAESIERLSAWIASGAAYDKPLVDAAAEFTSRKISDEERQFWSFQPLTSPEVPAVDREGWCRTPVDHFVLAKLDEKGIAPNPLANRRKLVRRAYLDLIGLPPDARGSRRLSGRRSRRRLRPADRPPAGQPALRRTLGPPLVGPGPICREPRLRAGLRPPERLSLSRLCNPRAQRRHAVRPIRPLAARRRRV